MGYYHRIPVHATDTPVPFRTDRKASDDRAAAFGADPWTSRAAFNAGGTEATASLVFDYESGKGASAVEAEVAFRVTHRARPLATAEEAFPITWNVRAVRDGTAGKFVGMDGANAGRCLTLGDAYDAVSAAIAAVEAKPVPA